MTTQPLEQAIATTRGILANVTPDQMGNDTPCASWKVSDLIDHVIGAQYFFLAGLNATPPTGAGENYASGDFLAAFDEATAAVVAAFSADGAMAKIVKLPFGEMPGAAVLGLAMTDTFQHAWDLARATGQSTDLAPELASGILAQARQSISDGFRGADGVAPFGAEQPASDDASNADKLAAFLGRTL